MLKLDYQKQIFTELLTDDGLLVMARGLGLDSVFQSFLQYYMDSRCLVLVINCPKEKELEFTTRLIPYATKPGLQIINNETSSQDRFSLFFWFG
jgi:DNA excision repair protein ERCC-4